MAKGAMPDNSSPYCDLEMWVNGRLKSLKTVPHGCRLNQALSRLNQVMLTTGPHANRQTYVTVLRI